jgi:hypothetical protein
MYTYLQMLLLLLNISKSIENLMLMSQVKYKSIGVLLMIKLVFLQLTAMERLLINLKLLEM